MDIGGIVAKNAGTAQELCAYGSIPVGVTRPLGLLSTDPTSSGAVAGGVTTLCYTNLGGSNLKLHIPSALVGTPLFGQIVYLLW